MEKAIRHFAIVEAPSHLGLRTDGVAELPDALLAAGLSDRLGARSAVKLRVPSHDPELDAETGMLNPRTLRDFSYWLADAIEALLIAGQFPVVLGGDCSVLLGPALALRRRGRYGLFFMDGHADFYEPDVEPTGEAASMELALVTGRGPDVLANLEGLRPLMRDEDIVAFGVRDAKIAAAEGSQPLPHVMRVLDLEAVHELGVEAATHEALAHLERRDGPDGFWIHLDADVLDDDVMPAVDHRMPGGLSWDELETALRSAVLSPRAIGIEITIFNPTLDHGGLIARRFVDVLARAMSLDR